MAYNPYAAPQAGPPGGMPGAPMYSSGPQPWEPGEVISKAWAIVKVHGVPLVIGSMIAGAAASVPQQLMRFQDTSHGLPDFESPFVWGVLAGGSVVGWVAQAFFQVGVSKMYVRAARGESPQLGDVFSGASQFLPMLGAMFLYMLAVILGFILLIVPGIILSLGLAFYPYFIVDQKMGAVDALKASWEATMGHKGTLLLLGFYGFGVMLLGMLACCIGMLPATAVITLASAIVYTRITGRMAPEAGGFGGAPPGGGYGYGPPPGGGYGGPPPGGGYGPPPGGGYGGPPGGGYGGPPPGGGYGPPPGGGYGPPPGGGYGPPR